jgi:hypothetical protein
MLEEIRFKNAKIFGKKTLCAITMILLMTFGAFTVLPLASASNPPIQIPTYAYLAITPNPVGVNQPVFLVMWLHMAPPTAAGNAGDRWHDFTITVTKPDGTTQKLGPFTSDPTGSTYTSFTPPATGTYKFEFKYSGQVCSLYNPKNGLPGSNSPYINDTFLPSSAIEYLTVQQEQVAPVEEYPLPTEYWQRPIEGQNVNWANVASHWLRGAYFGSFQMSGSYNLWQQSGIAPSSPHIIWTRPIEFGGVVGGNTAISGVGFYSGGSYEGRFGNSIIMYGTLFYQEPLGHSGSGGGYTAVDLRTGEVKWHREDIGISGSSAPSFGQLFDYESPNQHGVVGGLLWTNNFATAYDPFTGKVLYNLTSVPSGTEVYTPKGEIVRYVLNYNRTKRAGWLGLWNNTQDQMGLHLSLGTGTNAWQWRPNGKSVNMSTAYSWNVSISADLSGLSSPSIFAVLPGDIILGRSSSINPGVGDKFTPDPYTVWALSDKPTTRGQLLWIRNYTAPEGNITRRLGPVDPVNRVWTMFQVEDMQWLGYNLDNGDPIWGPTNTQIRAYEYYGSGEGGGQRGSVAYGNLYVQGFGGEIFAYDTKNGNLLWKFNNTNSGLDTPWGLRPIFLAAIADGKVYAFNNEHSPNQPLYRGNRIYAIDAYTGKEVYSMLGWSGQTGGQGGSTAVLADGFLAYYNYYDGQIYVVGKGPSATSVEAPLASITQGQSLIIKGTVKDESPGAKGKPAVSDESMGPWMEYIYMQKPIPANVTGVPVKLTAVDSSGAAVEIATVTTDISGMFYYKWTPQAAGAYKIIASFGGSNSYWPSYAETAVGVDTAPSPSVQPTSPPPIITPPPVTASPSPSPTSAPPPTEAPNTALYVGIAAVIIIAAVAAVALFLRRRK